MLSSSSLQMKKNCRLCSAHGIVISAVSHVCPFSECECSKCKLIRKRRAIVAEQTRIRRTQKKTLHPCVSPSSSSSSDEPHTNRAYLCQRCQNHGANVSKKNHICPNLFCSCSKCELWTNRSRLDEELRRSQEPATLQGFPLVLPPPTAGVNALPSTSAISAMLSTPTLPLIPPSSTLPLPPPSSTLPLLATSSNLPLIPTSSSTLPLFPSAPILPLPPPTSRYILEPNNTLSPYYDDFELPPGLLHTIIARTGVEYVN